MQLIMCKNMTLTLFHVNDAIHFQTSFKLPMEADWLNAQSKRIMVSAHSVWTQTTWINLLPMHIILIEFRYLFVEFISCKVFADVGIKKTENSAQNMSQNCNQQMKVLCKLLLHLVNYVLWKYRLTDRQTDWLMDEHQINICEGLTQGHPYYTLSINYMTIKSLQRNR